MNTTKSRDTCVCVYLVLHTVMQLVDWLEQVLDVASGLLIRFVNLTKRETVAMQMCCLIVTQGLFLKQDFF